MSQAPASTLLIYHYSPILHKPYGIRNSEIRNANALIPHHGAGSSWPIIPGGAWSGRIGRQNGAVSALPFPAPRIPLSQFDAEATLRRTGDPFLIDCEASISIHRTQHSGPSVPPPLLPPSRIPRPPASKFRNPESGVLKNGRRARGVLKRPRSVSAMLFLTPF
jgi:hypothetical protein